MSIRGFLSLAVLAILPAGVAAAAALVLSAPAGVPGFEAVRAEWRPSESTLLDRNGRVLQVRRTDFGIRRLGWTPLEEVSPALRDTVIAAEDKRFRHHRGVDLLAMAAAAWGNLTGDRRRGASTVTMQLAALLDPTLRSGPGGRSMAQKLRQMRAALAIERRWSKDQILEAYLNRLDFRGELQGIAATSRLLLDKHPSGLSAADGLILAALLPAPNAPPKQIAARACRLADRAAVPLECDDLDRQAEAVLARSAGRAPDADLAPHLAARLLTHPGEHLRTTLDADVQRFARDTLERHLRDLRHRNVRDGAVVVADNRSGDILAYVASGGPYSRSGRVDGARARRQAGSTLKPFLYGLALEKGYLTAASALDDAPINLETATGLYIPQNYDRDYKGLVSLRTALGNSLNIPAVRTLVLTGVEPFRLRLNMFGYTGIDRDGEHYGYSLALGSAEVSLLEQVAAYRALARGGLSSPLRLRDDDPTVADRRVLSAPAAHIVGDILSDPAARSLTFGLASSLTTPFWSAVKTGTSKAMRDNWAVGYTDRFTVGVWIGNFEGDSMQDVSGVTGAAPVWNAVVSRLHRESPSGAPPTPPGVIRQKVGFAPAIEPPRVESFVIGTETARVEVAASARTAPHIASPPNGVVIALDPDIPAANQRVSFEIGGARDGLSLMLNGERLDPARAERWTPVPGYHALTLVDADRQVVDSVRFTVRGAR